MKKESTSGLPNAQNNSGVWDATMNLRWRDTPEGKVLEQMWWSSTNQVEWREIPTV